MPVPSNCQRGIPCENPFESIRCCMVFSSRDFSTDKRDAWMYGIVVGWDKESLQELAAQFHWSPSELERLGRLHEAFTRDGFGSGYLSAPE